MHTRPIPSTGELLPIIGLGTYKGFDTLPGSASYTQLPGVLDALLASGGSVIDSSPMYGHAETAVGRLLAAAQHAATPFLATKVWTPGREAGIAQMQRSMALLGTDRVDLMQVHNLVDCSTHLATLREWKRAGRIRYVGVTHYTASAYAELESVLRTEPMDFVQINYSVADRVAEQRLLPLAMDRGIAVLANLPLGSGGVLRSVRGRSMPTWAATELDCTSWAQLLLKFVIGHPAVTCAIPGTSSAAHMADNALAGNGPLPDAQMRERIANCWGGP